ncbi:hypothetical protein JCGZ_10872 [Jatropha curcas]|uniref:Uncharacterized protein n=1 Tax=Jatropha curcas TaxID=180498 RepID=A0A067KUE3_JATCU|nr:hypothetical protein JCGZ_10872 [Jatropha curcas]
MQNSSKKLPYGMVLTLVFEFLEVKLNENEGYSVSKLDSRSLKLKDEEGDEEKEEETEKKKRREENGKSLIESLERMKNVNERKLATLKVKGIPYTPASEKPKRVKHTTGKHKVHGRKPQLHPSSKRPESSTETVPAQNLRSSKRLRTDPKSL